ncbi:hypothetical protein BSKO_01083 [Bryopsis sp. KO-2023]|nr:hypothetical protein BSKO_01083 [Bryopsis sp. KO-2023]
MPSTRTEIGVEYTNRNLIWRTAANRSGMKKTGFTFDKKNGPWISFLLHVPVATIMSASTSGQRCLSSRGALGAVTGRLQSLRVSPVRRAAPKIVRAEKLPYDYASPPSLEGVLGDKYAIIEVGGLQQFVEEGRWYTCNRLQAPPGATVKFPRVLALKNDGEFTVGRPFLEDVKVEAEILDEIRGPKVIVAKYKRKKHYRRKNGHRQELTKFKITNISKP